MAYVPTDHLRRMSKMLLYQAEMLANNYCFANCYDDPGDVQDVTIQLLMFFAEKIDETTEELNLKGV